MKYIRNRYNCYELLSSKTLYNPVKSMVLEKSNKEIQKQRNFPKKHVFTWT